MPVGGAETLLVNLMRKMDTRLVRPEIVCLKEPGPLGEEIAKEFPVHSNLLSHKWDLRILPRLVRLFRKQQADAVVTVGAGDKMFWGRIAAKLAGVPVVASALHSTGWPDGVGRLNRKLTAWTDAFIAVAESHGQFLRDVENFPASKVKVIRNGVDADRFRPDPDARRSVREELGLDDQAPLFGIVAALRPEKNHEMLIRAAARLRDSTDAHWLIIGDGPEREKIETLCQLRNLRGRVHLLGTRQDTPRLVAALDVFTLCSHNEASPVSILEAFACGVPVIATDVGSVSETVRHEETGLLVEAGDEEGFAASMNRALDDREWAQKMGTAGRQSVVENASLESMVNGYQRLLRDLLKTKRS